MNDTPLGATPPIEPDGEVRLTPRAKAKAERRREILEAATKLIARHGFRGVRLDDIGAAVGVSGPAMYRHFASKEDLLWEMLLDISERLLTAGHEVCKTEADARRRVEGLIGVQVDFVVTEPDLISVQYRDLGALPDTQRRKIRSLQREYVELWIDALSELHPEYDEVEVRIHVHGVIGLLNSSPRAPRAPRDSLRRTLTKMALSAMDA